VVRVRKSGLSWGVTVTPTPFTVFESGAPALSSRHPHPQKPSTDGLFHSETQVSSSIINTISSRISLIISKGFMIILLNKNLWEKAIQLSIPIGSFIRSNKKRQ